MIEHVFLIITLFLFNQILRELVNYRILKGRALLRERWPPFVKNENRVVVFRFAVLDPFIGLQLET